MTDHSIFSRALRSREEDFRRLDGERKEKSTTTTKKSTTSASDNKFIQAMQEFRTNFESGGWKAITPKSLNDARANLKKKSLKVFLNKRCTNGAISSIQ